MANEIDQDIQAFLGHLDTLAERLRPRRRAQDAHAPACSPRELRALQTLGQRSRVTMSDLAVLLDVPLSTATHTVDRLVAKGLVERKQAARDRRVVEIAFSRRGKRINQHAVASRQSVAHILIAVLSRPERETLLRQLAKLAATPTETTHDR